jgi:hypothetical protein
MSIRHPVFVLCAEHQDVADPVLVDMFLSDGGCPCNACSVQIHPCLMDCTHFVSVKNRAVEENEGREWVVLRHKLYYDSVEPSPQMIEIRCIVPFIATFPLSLSLSLSHHTGLPYPDRPRSPHQSSGNGLLIFRFFSVCLWAVCILVSRNHGGRSKQSFPSPMGARKAPKRVRHSHRGHQWITRGLADQPTRCRMSYSSDP